jgi:nicotinamide-nucleotide amidase
MNLANKITLSRLLAIPPIMFTVLYNFPGHYYVSAALFLFFSLTDVLDGTIARRRGIVSDLGKFLDPLADKLFILSVLMALVQVQLLPSYIVVIIMGREFAITLMRSIAATRGKVISATPFGKTKTITQVGAVLLLMLSGQFSQLKLAALIAVYAAAAFTIYSGIDYVFRFWDVLGASKVEDMEGLSIVDLKTRRLIKMLYQKLDAIGGTISVAESCTGGLLGAALTSIPGSSKYFMGGVISYSNDAKILHLGVSPDDLSRYGAVSEQVALAMAKGARQRFDTTVGVGITGIAGPEGGTEKKPVGLVHIAVVTASKELEHRFTFGGTRDEVRLKSVKAALQMVSDVLDIEASDSSLPSLRTGVESELDES